MLQSVRRFFTDRGYTEVETPVRVAAPCPEPHIDAEPSGDRYLRTSPELYLKRLVAAGLERVFELGPCFRRGERGPLHRPEYTMLEWYRAGADYMAILGDAKALLAAVLGRVLGSTRLLRRGTAIEAMSAWECMTVEEAFLAFAGWNPVRDFDEDRFDIDLVDRVLPALPPDRPAVLKDYPPEAAALARCRGTDPVVAERWELYLGGVELANAFSELTDVGEQRRRFEACLARRAASGQDVYPLDEFFLAALADGLPSCGGAALGIDRLVMLMTGADSLDEVRAFCG